MKKPSFRLLLALAWLALLASACNLPLPVASAPPTAPTALIVTPGVAPTATSVLPVAGTTATSTATPSTIGADGVGDPYFPQLGNGGYDVQHYTINLAVDMEGGDIFGTTTIEAKTTQALARFDLDYSGPAITALSVDGQPAAFTRSGGELVISLSSPLPAGQTFSTAVTYRGQPGAGLPANTPAYSLGWVPYGNRAPRDDGGVLVSAEPQGQAAWYPLNETPADKASYTFRITVAKPWVVAANGLQQSVTDNGGTRTYLWGTDNPVAPYLVTLAIGKLSEETDTSSDVLVRNFFDEGFPDAAKTGFSRIPQMITYYESLFGPYPFEAYGVVGHNLRLDYSLETQTLTVFGNSFTSEAVVAHELAHSWFGDSVTPYHWEDIWLNEGFASFAARMWQEHTQGKDSVRQSLGRSYQALVRNESRAITIGNPGPDDLFSGQVYDRGELTLAALRALLGDETMFKVLRTYAQRFYHGNVTTHDLIAAAEEISGQKLDDFFQAWLYQTRLPDIPALGLFRKDYTTN